MITKGTVSDTQAVSLTVLPSGTLIITTTSLPSGTVGVGYNQTIQASGGTGGYVWTLDVGPLPAGLNLDMAATGLSTTLTGTPTRLARIRLRFASPTAWPRPTPGLHACHQQPAGPNRQEEGGNGGGGCSSGGELLHGCCLV